MLYRPVGFQSRLSSEIASTDRSQKGCMRDAWGMTHSARLLYPVKFVCR
jgi:hypothetical protein